MKNSDRSVAASVDVERVGIIFKEGDVKKRLFCVILVCLAMAGCASAPVARQIQDSWTVPGSFDAVWGATLEALAELNLSIVMPIDKGSGIITTELMNLPDNRKGCWDCGKLAFTQFSKGHRGKLTVFVKPAGEAQSELKVVANYEVLFMDTTHEALTKSRFERAVQGDTLWSRPCFSTGQFEREIYEQVSAKVK